MFEGLSATKIWAVIVRARRIIAMARRLDDAYDADPTLIPELKAIFGGPADPEKEVVARARVANLMEATQQEIDAMERPNKNVDNN